MIFVTAITRMTRMTVLGGVLVLGVGDLGQRPATLYPIGVYVQDRSAVVRTTICETGIPSIWR